MTEPLRAAGLISEHEPVRYERLTGGVSSDIWRVDTPAGSFCVKRALPKLRVAAEWLAPIERNRYEVIWLKRVAEIAPKAVPRVLLHDERAMLYAMSWLDSTRYKLWKTELHGGRVDPGVAHQVGDLLGQIHAATADDRLLREVLPTSEIFEPIRLEPYLQASALRHPDLSAALWALSDRTKACQRVMIHGDVSPKNLLIGSTGPVFVDAECACIGDPAFDLAFCLNHLLLKCLWCPSAQAPLLVAFEVLQHAYLKHVDWESPTALQTRTASLLPGLLLARVDGKSPVEYLTEEPDKASVRRVARQLLQKPVATLAAVAETWRQELKR